MFSNRLSVRVQRYSRFSLRSLLLVLGFASLGFAAWWQWPVQIDRVPPELGQVPEKFYACGNSLYQVALWTEESPTGNTRGDMLDPFADRGGGPVFARAGKCWARRKGLSDWQLDGPAEVFTKDNQRVIRAEFARGKLHGEFRSWFTTGQVREAGHYFRGGKDGVWEMFEQFTGKVKSHEEYDRGDKAGIWTSARGREHYRDGKLFLREKSESYSGKWTIEEFGADEKLQRVSYWNKDRSQQSGVDHYLAGQRHGNWYRVEFENQRPIVCRGQWVDGIPSGEWVYEREKRPPQRLEFRHGSLVSVDGEPVCDVLLQRLTREGDESLREDLLKAENRNYAYDQRKSVFDWLCESYWPRPRIDPQLVATQADFHELWEEKLPSDFEFDNLPASAAFCLSLRGANLTLDYRFGTVWITTPELAAAWQDETGTRPWFEKIESTPWIWRKDAEGISHVVDSPYCRRDQHFGEDWQGKWQSYRKLEFLTPLTCRLGTARHIEGSQAIARPRLRFPEDLLEHHSSREESYSFDELIALECEAEHCRLVLRGDTLVLEPW